MLPCLRGAVRRTEGWIITLITMLTFLHPLRDTRVARPPKTGGTARILQLCSKDPSTSLRRVIEDSVRKMTKVSSNTIGLYLLLSPNRAPSTPLRLTDLKSPLTQTEKCYTIFTLIKPKYLRSFFFFYGRWLNLSAKRAHKHTLNNTHEEKTYMKQLLNFIINFIF